MAEKNSPRRIVAILTRFESGAGVMAFSKLQATSDTEVTRVPATSSVKAGEQPSAAALKAAGTSADKRVAMDKPSGFTGAFVEAVYTA